jgi:CHAD domain-containing protein
MKRKWEIEKLKGSKQFKKSANIILRNRIESLLSLTDKYFKNLTVENLHDIRIALRRVRYSMESFIVCYDNKIFLKFYYKIQLLQDLSGAVRDVDIFLENIDSIVSENAIRVEPDIFSKAKEKKNILEEKFKLELMRFTLSKILKDFLKQITY